MWDAGLTYFKVADLEEPYGAILGASFLAKHRIEVHLNPPSLLYRSLSSPNLVVDLLAPSANPPTLAEAKKTMSAREIRWSERTEREGAQTAILARVAELEKEVVRKEEDRKEEKEQAERLE